MSSERPSSSLLVAISGKSGCGNSTVSRMVASALGLRVVNYTFKDLARERGMTFEQICLLAEGDPQYDRAIDRMQVELAAQGGCVLGSRLAIWLLRDQAYTVYLSAPLSVRAARIARRDGLAPDQALSETQARDQRDHDRYRRLYGYDVDRFDFAALVVDATMGQDEVAARIVEHAAEMPGGPAAAPRP
jgi:CMP/dCMP kinase